MSERLTEEHLKADLEMLSHGGGEAISLFMTMSKRLHESAGEEGLRDWITIAAPALPEKERAEILIHLMEVYLCLDAEGPAGKDVE